MQKISEVLHTSRRSKKLTLQQLSDLTGISMVSLNKYEKGTIIPNISNLYKLSNVLEFDYDEASAISAKEKARKNAK